MAERNWQTISDDVHVMFTQCRTLLDIAVCLANGNSRAHQDRLNSLVQTLPQLHRVSAVGFINDDVETLMDGLRSGFDDWTIQYLLEQFTFDVDFLQTMDSLLRSFMRFGRNQTEHHLIEFLSKWNTVMLQDYTDEVSDTEFIQRYGLPAEYYVAMDHDFDAIKNQFSPQLRMIYDGSVRELQAKLIRPEVLQELMQRKETKHERGFTDFEPVKKKSKKI